MRGLHRLVAAVAKGHIITAFFGLHYQRVASGMMRSMNRALSIRAGAAALRHLHQDGLHPDHLSLIPGAAGGAKWLVLKELDRQLFEHWLPQGTQPVDLVGSSIGKLATHCRHAGANATAVRPVSQPDLYRGTGPGRDKSGSDKHGR